VLYATWYGSSRDVGVWISEGMGGIANVYDVRENMDLSGYDHLKREDCLVFGKEILEIAG